MYINYKNLIISKKKLKEKEENKLFSNEFYSPYNDKLDSFELYSKKNKKKSFEKSKLTSYKKTDFTTAASATTNFGRMRTEAFSPSNTNMDINMNTDMNSEKIKNKIYATFNTENKTKILETDDYEIKKAGKIEKTEGKLTIPTMPNITNITKINNIYKQIKYSPPVKTNKTAIHLKMNSNYSKHSRNSSNENSFSNNNLPNNIHDAIVKKFNEELKRKKLIKCKLTNLNNTHVLTANPNQELAKINENFMLSNNSIRMTRRFEDLFYSPDELLLKYFSDEEIKIMRDDPAYFRTVATAFTEEGMLRKRELNEILSTEINEEMKQKRKGLIKDKLMKIAHITLITYNPPYEIEVLRSNDTIFKNFMFELEQSKEIKGGFSIYIGNNFTNKPNKNNNNNNTNSNSNSNNLTLEDIIHKPYDIILKYFSKDEIKIIMDHPCLYEGINFAFLEDGEFKKKDIKEIIIFLKRQEQMNQKKLSFKGQIYSTVKVRNSSVDVVAGSRLKSYNTTGNISSEQNRDNKGKSKDSINTMNTINSMNNTGNEDKNINTTLNKTKNWEKIYDNYNNYLSGVEKKYKKKEVEYDNKRKMILKINKDNMLVKKNQHFIMKEKMLKHLKDEHSLLEFVSGIRENIKENYRQRHNLLNNKGSNFL